MMKDLFREMKNTLLFCPKNRKLCVTDVLKKEKELFTATKREVLMKLQDVFYLKSLLYRDPLSSLRDLFFAISVLDKDPQNIETETCFDLSLTVLVLVLVENIQ